VTVRDAFAHKSERERGLPAGSIQVDLTAREVVAFLREKASARLRGLLRCDPKVYIGTNVKLLHPARREIGRGRLLETERQFVPFLQAASESVKRSLLMWEPKVIGSRA